MKKLIDYKDDIHKCSKCGLCQSVCPVYKVTGNDCSVSRGKFIMLNGIIKGDLKLSANLNKYLDMCLKCNACRNFCPSNIDARKIFTCAKTEYFKKSLGSIFLKFIHSSFVFNLVLNCSKFAANVYRFLKLDKVLKKFYPILQKTGWLGKKIILANEFISPLPDCIKSNSENVGQLKNPIGNKIVYFKGCVNEYVNSRTRNAVESVLSQMGAEIIPVDFQCCGVPFLSSGNVEQFLKRAEYNLSKIPDDFDYLITDCASCQNAFREYESFIEDKKILEKLKLVNEKSINVVEFVVKNAKYFDFSEKISFTFHKPCHLNSMTFVEEFLKKARNIEYREMNEFDSCCGFSGEFAIKNPEISSAISAKKIQNALSAEADYIVTSCPACVLGLNQGLIENNEKANVLNFIELVAMSNIDLKANYQNEDCKKSLFDNFVKGGM